MDGEIDWRLVEDSSPENRELGQIIRRLEGFCSGNSSLDWKESRRRCAEALSACLADLKESHPIVSVLRGADYEVGGDEHYVIRVESHPERVFKITHGDSFGCYPYFLSSDPDLTGRHFHGSINEDPVFYFKRWMLLNFIGDYQTRFEGMLVPEAGLRMVRVCMSQPTLDGPSPERSEIRRSLEPYGFECISEDAYLHFDTRILLTDAAPRNVRIVDGTPALFDAIASIASSKVYEWAHRLRRLRTKN